MTRRCNRAVWMLALMTAAVAPVLPGQMAAAPAVAGEAGEPKIAGYDVVSIKPNETGPGSTSVQTNADSFSATNLSLLGLIGFAYNMRSDQLSGGPAWATSTHYDIVAKITEGDPAELKKLNPEQRQRFIQAMLAERFHLQAHMETKTLPVYDLIVIRSGPKLHEVALADKDKPLHGVGSGGTSIYNGHLTAHDISMSRFADTMGHQLGRTVLDKTGLTGRYDFDLTWTRDELEGTPDAAAPPLFTALQEQLGLKLQAGKGPVETLVIDHLDKPSEN